MPTNNDDFLKKFLEAQTGHDNPIRNLPDRPNRKEMENANPDDMIKNLPDRFNRKKGGSINLKDCKINTAENKNSKLKNCW